jgi:hypothetical protein
MTTRSISIVSALRAIAVASSTAAELRRSADDLGHNGERDLLRRLGADPKPAEG